MGLYEVGGLNNNPRSPHVTSKQTQSRQGKSRVEQSREVSFKKGPGIIYDSL